MVSEPLYSIFRPLIIEKELINVFLSGNSSPKSKSKTNSFTFTRITNSLSKLTRMEKAEINNIKQWLIVEFLKYVLFDKGLSRAIDIAILVKLDQNLTILPKYSTK
ncbi:unnamed protein product [Brachionus calyciflorus]|uniref:Uncharacterized protein n=1 Tax=Brachionus calyciflorus TaxID=104777 RepID=A0A814RZR3_9BILA|nr:unnamed protein product [Brachionus calyciflorus]